MPLLLRTVRENRWHRETAARFLEQGDVPGDPLSDLNTQDNTLSVWVVAEDRSNIERIVRAVAVGRTGPSAMGYVLFSSELLADANISEPIANPGATPDEHANQWHRDLVSLSGAKLVALARALLTRGETSTILRKRMRELVEDGIRSKELPEKIADWLNR